MHEETKSQVLKPAESSLLSQSFARMPMAFALLREEAGNAPETVSFRVEYANAAYAALCNLQPEDVVGQPFSPLFADGDEAVRLAAYHSIAAGREETVQCQMRCPIHQHQYRVVAYSPGPGLCALLLQNRTTDWEEQAYRERFDGVTGLYNRETFYKESKKRMSDHPNQLYVVIQMDIERFKVVNELFGMEEGDKLLYYIGESLHMHIQKEGVYGRLGADLFGICFPYTKQAVQKLLAFLRDRLQHYPLNFHIQPCFGLYLAEERELPVETMCDRAGLAMKTIKGTYLKRYAFYDKTLQQAMVEEQEIVNDMREALSTGQFDLYLQPKYNMENSRVFGAEALVRWFHPKKGMISPAAFIPIFERNGFILQLDPYIWEKTCQILRTQLDETGKALPISVNVSRMNLYNPNLCQMLVLLVKKYRLEPKLLELELTESAYSENQDQLMEVVRQLQHNGFTVLMDDFGSGYSSLNMLKDISVNGLKIDLRFLAGFEQTAGRGGRILSSVIRMAQWLNLPVTVEGVETRRQAEFLRSISCIRAQGYYYARPMPLRQYRALADQNWAITELGTETGEYAMELDEFWNPDSPGSLLFNNTVDAGAVYEFRGETLELVRCNDRYLELTGGTRDHLLQDSRMVLEQISEGDQTGLRRLFHTAAETRGVAEGRYHRKGEEGALLCVQAKVRYLAGGENRALFYLSLRDITQQVQLEQKNIEMAETLRELLDALPIGIGLFELEEREVELSYVNECFCRLCGYSKQDYMALSKETPYLLLPEEETKRIRTLSLRAFRSGSLMEESILARHREGRMLRLSMRSAPFPGQVGQRIFCAALSLDSNQPAEPSQLEAQVPPTKEKKRKKHRRSSLTSVLMEEKGAQVSALPEYHSILPTETAQAAMTAAMEAARNGSMSALLLVEWSEPLGEEQRVQAEGALNRLFGRQGILSRLSAQTYCILLRDTTALDVREQVEQLCAWTGTGESLFPARTIGISYAVAPMPSLSMLMEQAAESVQQAKVFGKNQYAEYARKA